MTKCNRIEYYDFLRGLAILMVVGIHTFAVYPIDSLLGASSTLMRQTLNCAVPIFLTLSGFFLGKKTLNSKVERIRFWSKQIPKVYVPVLIWSIPYFVASMITQNGGGYLLVKQTVLLFICGYSVYYFIALIIQYYFLLPFLQKYHKSMLPISVVISFLSITLITLVTKLFGLNLPLIVYAGPFPVWIVFFMIGVYYSLSSTVPPIKTAIALLIGGLVLSCVETYFINSIYGGGYGIKISSFIFSIGAVLLAISPKTKNRYRPNRFTSLIAAMGKISFGIYLTHMFVITFIRHIYPLDSWLLLWLASIVITALLIVVAKKVLPEKLNYYIGFNQ